METPPTAKFGVSTEDFGKKKLDVLESNSHNFSWADEKNLSEEWTEFPLLKKSLKM